MKTIKRTNIYKALRTEPLLANRWITVNNRAENLNTIKKPAKKVPDCKVCAIGAVLRANTNWRPKKIDNYCDDKFFVSTCFNVSCYSTKNDIVGHLNNGHYLAALSAYFESTIPVKGAYNKNHRERLVRFVKKHFPREIKL